MAQISRGSGGYCLLMVRSATVSGGLAADSIRPFIATNIDPQDALNKNYYPAMNISSHLTGFIKDGRTGAITITGYMKPYGSGAGGWCDASIMKSLLLDGTGIGGYNDLFLIGWRDTRTTGTHAGVPRTFDYCRLVAMNLSQVAEGGPVSVTMTFISALPNADQLTYSDFSWAATPVTALTAGLPTTPDYGQIAGRGTTTVDGLSEVKSWSLSLMREGMHDFVFSTSAGYNANAADYPVDVVSRHLRGQLSIVTKAASATSVITDSGQVVLTLNKDKSSSTGRFTMTMDVEADHNYVPVDPGSVFRRVEMTLLDRADGLVPLVIAAA